MICYNKKYTIFHLSPLLALHTRTREHTTGTNQIFSIYLVKEAKFNRSRGRCHLREKVLIANVEIRDVGIVCQLTSP